MSAVMANDRQAVIEYLLDRSDISHEAVARAQAVAERTRQPVERVLNQLGQLSDDDLAGAYAEVAGLKIWQPEHYPPDVDIIDLGLGEEFLRRVRALPLALEDGRLICAAVDPFDDEMKAGLSFATGRDIVYCVARLADWRRSLEVDADDIRSDGFLDERRVERDLAFVEDHSVEGQAVELVSQAFAAAVERGASDIHFEPRRNDIRGALSVLGSEGPMRDVGQAILGGASVDTAFSSIIPQHSAHLRGLIAAGEARGDLASGLEAAASVLATGRKIRQQVIEAVSYPAFVFLTALIAMGIILLVVVPAIAPLLSDSGQPVPVYFAAIVWLSELLQTGWPIILTGLGFLAIGLGLGWRYGGLRAWLQVWLLNGLFGSVFRPLVFGGYAKTLGQTLASGASLTESLRLCGRGLGNTEARNRLEIVSTLIRQGSRLSEALRHVRGFPAAIVRLCEIGEASGAVGPMLAKAGEREERQALVQIDRLSKVLGPALLVGLGGLIGALMGGVLTALTDIGTVAGT